MTKAPRVAHIAARAAGRATVGATVRQACQPSSTARGAPASPQALRDAGGGVAIVPTAPERQRNSDNDHPYRHDSHFHYLTGFDEPERLAACIDGDGRSTLVCRAEGRRARDLGRHPPRPRRGAGGARRRRGAAARRARRADAARRSPTSPRSGSRSACTRPAGAASTAGSTRVRARERQRRRGARAASATWRRCWPRCGSSRTPTSSRRCAAPRAISAGAHARAMRFCAARFAPRPAGAACANTRSRPSCCTSSAATARRARPTRSIVAAGANACVLHYARRRRRAARRRAVPDRRRLRARRLRQRRHPHLPRRRPLQRRRSASSTTSSQAAQAGRRRRHPPRRAPARRPRRGGARARAGHARHRPARPQQASATSTR